MSEQTPARGENGRDSARWFEGENRPAILDFWSIYNAHFDAVFQKCSAPLFALEQFRGSFGAEPEASKRRALWREYIGAGINGDWSLYEAFLRRQAAAYAAHGVSFGEWLALSQALGDALGPLIIGELSESPERMGDALHAMCSFLHTSIAVIGHEFLTAKEAALRASERQLRALAARVETAREDERKRISREIHDQLGQQLTSVKLDIAWLARRCPTAPETADVRERLAAISSLVDTTVTTVRRLATELRPGVLDDLGLEDALAWQASEFTRHSGIPVAVEAPDHGARIGDEHATTLFRCFQEILTNVARHANATSVAARLTREDDVIVLEVSDDGRGITPEEVAKMTSLGLVGMRERAILLDGTFRIEGAPGHGTTVTIRLPSRASAATERS
jgi:signal transduction histidine kinase